MKTKTISLFTCMLLSGMVVTSNVTAQQQKYPPPPKPTLAEVLNENKVGDYSYIIIPAPDNSFEYVVLQNRRMVFRQPSLKLISNNGKMYFDKKEQAKKAAIMTIEKIKNRMLPALTNEEIKKVVTQ